MDENKSFNFYVGDAGNRVDKTVGLTLNLTNKISSHVYLIFSDLTFAHCIS